MVECKRQIVLLIGGLLFFSASILAGESGVPASPSGTEPVPVFRTSKLIGREVQSAVGEPLGAVEDVMVDARGLARFVVISYGGFLGMGDKLAPVPWSMVAFPERDGPLRVALSKERFLQAPAFDRQGWARMQSLAFIAEVETHFSPRLRTIVSFEAANVLPPPLKSLDQDGDGAVSRREAERSMVVNPRFAEADRNGDGTLDGDEYRALAETVLKAWEEITRRPGRNAGSLP